MPSSFSERTALPAGYEIREMSAAEFNPLWHQHAKQIFDENDLTFRWRSAVSDEEEANIVRLARQMGEPIEIRLGLFFKGEFVGWSAGNQTNAAIYYMRNSAVLPEHRRKGLYTAMLLEHVKRAIDLGFQEIYSRHIMVNNDVIIPKLKAGFVITGFELNDSFGTLVKLSYLTNTLRRKMLTFRSGHIRPDDEIRKHLKI